MKLTGFLIIWGFCINALSAQTTPIPTRTNEPLPGFEDLKAYLNGCRRVEPSRTEPPSLLNNEIYAAPRPTNVLVLRESVQFSCETEPNRPSDPAETHEHMLAESNNDDCSLTQPESSEAGSSRSQRKFNCDLCSKSFDVRYKLERHKKTHNEDRPAACRFCSSSYKNERNLKEHMLRKHSSERSYSCDLCGKSFAVKQDLTHHMWMHSDDKLSSCEFCHKKFRRKDELRLHVRTHTGEKPYSCEICGRCFSVSSSRSRHMYVHTNEKPLECNFCGKCFKSKFGLAEHVRNVHSGTKKSLESGLKTGVGTPKENYVTQDSGIHIGIAKQYQEDEFNQVSIRFAEEEVRECSSLEPRMDQEKSDQSLEDFGELELMQETARDSSRSDVASQIIEMALLDYSDEDDELSETL
ncbi:hypothetical protein QAD02_009654 [Eretmocerus hayati]|uniref:Uncharacterized protein n=1 Tax=Eretmocerus hayati TaxID=131215 RepID=A0ACC2NBC1_9HYME|nr:hypothetical protein QAD02_009654 [Eretmocerus hayati]